jgi:hypothetical protein
LAAPALRLSEVIKAPMAICANSVLAAASLALQGYHDVVVDGRLYPLSLNLFTIAESGERKTACDTEALTAIRVYAERLRQKRTKDLELYTNDSAAFKKAREEALRNGKTREEKLALLNALGPEPLEPLQHVLIASEPTYEGLVKLFLKGQPSLGLIANDAAQLIGGFGMSHDNLIHTLSGFSKLWDRGVVDRIRALDGISELHGRRLATHLMAQPLVANRLLQNSDVRDQGYLSRCLTAWPLTTAGTRSYAAVNLRQDPIIRIYDERLLDILQTKLPLVEGTQNELSPPAIPLSPEATTSWVEFYHLVEAQLANERPFSPIRGFANKCPEHVLRVAGVLETWANLEAPEISATCITAAITLIEHYLSEALRLYREYVEDPDVLLAEKLLFWAQKRGDKVCLVDIYQKGPAAIQDSIVARRVSNILENTGWFVPVPGGAEIDGQYRRKVWMVERS